MKQKGKTDQWTLGYFAGIRVAKALLGIYGVTEGARRIKKIDEKSGTIVVIL